MDTFRGDLRRGDEAMGWIRLTLEDGCLGDADALEVV